MLPSPHHSGAWGPGQLPKKRKCQTHLKGEVCMSHHFWSFYSHLLLSPYRAAFNLPPSANRRLHTLQLKCLVSARSENPYTLEGVHSRKIKAHEKKLQPHEWGGGTCKLHWRAATTCNGLAGHTATCMHLRNSALWGKQGKRTVHGSEQLYHLVEDVDDGGGYACREVGGEMGNRHTFLLLLLWI